MCLEASVCVYTMVELLNQFQLDIMVIFENLEKLTINNFITIR